MRALFLISAGRYLQAFWRMRSVRERKLLGVAGVFLLLFVLVMLFGWLQGERHRLDIVVPLAEARLAQMQMAADECVHLKAQPLPNRLAGSQLSEALRAGGRARGLSYEIELTSEGGAVKGQGSFDALISWLADVQRDLALRPLRLDVSRDGNVAHFEVTFVYSARQ